MDPGAVMDDDVLAYQLRVGLLVASAPDARESDMASDLERIRAMDH